MDLQDVRVASLDKPDGWVTFDVSSEPNEDGDGLYVNFAIVLFSFPILASKPVYGYVLQIIVVANHMSGKDTHVRGLRILGPAE
jgi:anaphase-promoting complex subunit 10